MAKLIESGRGKTLELTTAEGDRFAQILSRRLVEQHIGLPQVREASTLSDATISARLRNVGEGDKRRIALWGFIALCDALKLNPVSVAKQLGVELPTQAVSSSRWLVAQRRSRKVTEHEAVTEVVEQLPDDDRGHYADVVMAVEPFITLVEQVVNRRVEELLGLAT